MNKNIKFIAAITIQTLIILTIILFKLSVLSNGTEILLKIAPVDPKDYLRGDYVSFQYEISRVQTYYAHGETLYNGDTVYVTLQKNGKYWHVIGIEKIQPKNESVFIKGKITSGGLTPNTKKMVPIYNRVIFNQEYIVNYGIEQYYIPEGKGRNINLRFNASALIRVDDSGNSVIKRLYIDEKPWP